MRKNCDRFEPDTEGPGDFGEGVVVRVNEGKGEGTDEEVLYTEGIEVRVVCRTVARGHQVDCVGGGGDEKELEDRIVVRFVEIPEEIHVACYVDD